MTLVIGIAVFMVVCLILVFVQSYFSEIMMWIAIAVIIYLAYNGFHFFGAQLLEWVNSK